MNQSNGHRERSVWMMFRRPQQGGTIACVALTGTLILSGLTFGLTGSALTTVATTTHQLPIQSKSVMGVQFLCGPTQAYDCTTGGYSGSEPWGYYTSFGSTDSAGRLHNCTSYAAFKVDAEHVKKPAWYDNANGWAKKASDAGTPVDQTPSAGSIAQWNGGGYGHVAYVEAVDSTGIVITEDNYIDSTSKYYPGGYTAKIHIDFTSNALPDNYIHFSTSSGGVTGGAGGAGGGSKPKVDLVFAIDTTGSMGPYIANVQASAQSIATRLFAQADARVGLVDYKDLYACPSDGYAAQVDLNFSTSPSAFNAVVSTLVASGGCDTPESVYSGVMKAIGMPWRSGVTKAVLVMGDAGPHDPEPVTGYTAASVVAAAKAVDPATLYMININGGGSPYFEDLATGTAGASYLNSDPAAITTQITQAISTITESPLTADPGGPYVGVVGRPIVFNAGGSSSPAGGISTYEWDFDGNGVYDHTTTGTVTSHVYRTPYTGTVGLRITTAASPPQTATATAGVQVFVPTAVRYTGDTEGEKGDRLELSASLTDGAHARVSGQLVIFSLGTQSCSGTTNRLGDAKCVIKIAQPRGRYLLAVQTSGAFPYGPSGVNAVVTVDR